MPGLDAENALLLKMIEQHLGQLLPLAVQGSHRPWFASAGRIMETSRYPWWVDKIRVVPAGAALIPPSIDPSVQRAVAEAQLRELQLNLTHRRRGADRGRTHRVSPLGLLQRAPVSCLSGRLSGKDCNTLSAMHRIESAQLRPGDAVELTPGFAVPSLPVSRR